MKDREPESRLPGALVEFAGRLPVTPAEQDGAVAAWDIGPFPEVIG